jgi:penicillin-binding protein 1A
VAIEDNEFYDHWGVNPKGIVRAFFVNLFSGSIKQGGSTITQQLAKILLTSRERNIYRKIKEAFIALMIESKFTKEQILNLYLNQIFLGHGAYGVQAAAKLYFQKDVWDLNLAECALLATLPSAPNLYSPIKYPKASITRHKIVLAKMVEMGYITVEQAEKAFLDFWPDYLYKIGDIPPTITTFSSRIDKAPWFTEYIRRELIKNTVKMLFIVRDYLFTQHLTLTSRWQVRGFSRRHWIARAPYLEAFLLKTMILL